MNKSIARPMVERAPTPTGAKDKQDRGQRNTRVNPPDVVECDTVYAMDTDLSPSELLDLSIEPNWARNDPERRRCLIVQLDGAPYPEEDDVARLSQWLAQQPIPTIGVGGTSSAAREHFGTATGDAQVSVEERTREGAENTASKHGTSLLGATDNPPNRLADAVDLIVESPDELRRVREQIACFPKACAVLVQVLRTSTKLDITDALTVESLAYAALQGGSEFSNWLKNNPTRNPKAKPSESLLLLERQGNALQITLNSPENRNALSAAMRDALAEAFQLAIQDHAIAHIDVSANGPCFSAGGDLTEFGTMTDLALAHGTRMTHMPARYLAACRDRCTFRVHGTCIGAGIELPAFAARLVAKPNTTFRLPEVGMGLIPGAGGCVSIPRRIGRQRTASLAILGHAINAEQALAWGLIDAIET